MLTKNVIAYYDKRIVARAEKVSEMLEALFRKVSKSFVAPNPFVYRPGLTRGSILVEATEVPYTWPYYIEKYHFLIM